MSNIIERKNAPRQGSNLKGNPTKGGKFVGAMRKLAQKRSASRSKAPLQVGNVLTKKAPQGGSAKFTSNKKGLGDKGLLVQPTEAQEALNEDQQGD